MNENIFKKIFSKPKEVEVNNVVKNNPMHTFTQAMDSETNFGRHNMEDTYFRVVERSDLSKLNKIVSNILYKVIIYVEGDEESFVYRTEFIFADDLCDIYRDNDIIDVNYNSVDTNTTIIHTDRISISYTLPFESQRDIYDHIKRGELNFKKDCDVVNKIISELEKKREDREKKSKINLSIITDSLIDLEDMSFKHKYEYDEHENIYKIKFKIKNILSNGTQYVLNDIMVRILQILSTAKPKIESNFEYCSIEISFASDKLRIVIRTEKPERDMDDDDDGDDHDDYA